MSTELHPLVREFNSCYTDFSLAYHLSKKCSSPVSADAVISLDNLLRRMQLVYKEADKPSSSESGWIDKTRIKEGFEISCKQFGKVSDKFFSSKSSLSPSITVADPILEMYQAAGKQKFFLFEQQDPSTSFMDLDYPCYFEYGGITYPSAMHAFLAQMYTRDGSEMFKLSAMPLKEAAAYAALHGIPRGDWYNIECEGSILQIRESVMLNVLRAKFGQNEELRRRLLATLDTALIARPYPRCDDPFWGDGTDGKGANREGDFLMQVRGECGGVGKVERPESYFKKMEEEQGKASEKRELLPLPLRKSEEQLREEISYLNQLPHYDNYLQQTTFSRGEELRLFNNSSTMNMPFDRSLVVLSTGEYINANTVCKSTMIATRAPDSHTGTRFWQMVLDYKVPTIAMLNGRGDFHGFFYCPETKGETVTFGDIKITLLEDPEVVSDPSWKLSRSDDVMHGIKKSLFLVEKNDLKRTVTHYQYLNWRDNDIANEFCLASLIKEVTGEVEVRKQKEEVGPVVVHCYAGVGRTAVFAASYEQFLKHRKKETIDLAASVRGLRDPEQGRYYKMLEGTHQYLLTHRTLCVLTT